MDSQTGKTRCTNEAFCVAGTESRVTEHLEREWWVVTSRREWVSGLDECCCVSLCHFCFTLRPVKWKQVLCACAYACKTSLPDKLFIFYSSMTGWLLVESQAFRSAKISLTLGQLEWKVDRKSLCSFKRLRLHFGSVLQQVFHPSSHRLSARPRLFHKQCYGSMRWTDSDASGRQIPSSTHTLSVNSLSLLA